MPGATSKTEPILRDSRFSRRPANGCSGCRQDFTSVELFDRHRVGTYEYTHEQGLTLERSTKRGSVPKICTGAKHLGDLFSA